MSSYSENDAEDAPLNLSLKTSSDAQGPTTSENVLDLIMSKGTGKSDSASSVNNLSNLQNLTAGIGLSSDSKGENNQILFYSLNQMAQ